MIWNDRQLISLVVGLHASMEAGFAAIRQRIDQMSQTLQQQLAADTASIAAMLTTLVTDLSAIAVQLQNAVPPVGSLITQSDVDAANANVASLQALVSQAAALVTPVPPAPPAP